MFLYAPFTLCPSAPAPYSPSPREQYIDALRAAEANYLSFKAAEREEEALTHRLRELRLRKQEHQLRTLGPYFSEDAYKTYGMNHSGAYHEGNPYMINLAEHQAFRAGHDCHCCDSLGSSMYPRTYCSDASIVDLHLVGSSSPAILLSHTDGPKCKVVPSLHHVNVFSLPGYAISADTTVQKPWIPSSLDSVDGSTGVIFPLAESQTLAPTLSFSRRRRGARPFRRPRLHHPFRLRPHGPGDNELLKNLQYYIPILKQHPVETSSEGDIHDKVDFANIFDTLPKASPEPDTEIAPASEGEAKAVSTVPAETTSPELDLDTRVPAASTIPSANRSTADSLTEITETTASAEITSSLDKIRTIEATFNALKENFILPVKLDFLPSTPSTPSAPSVLASDSDTESESVTDHLTYSNLNRPVRSYEQALTVLLEQLDGVDSLGDADVRKSRKEVVKRVELALEELEREVDGQWKIRILEPLAQKEKVGDEVESKGAVLGLRLDESENESKPNDDTHKQDGYHDSADVTSRPLREIPKPNDAPIVTPTVNSADDVSAPTITTSVHGNNPIQATLQKHLEFSDVTPVDIPPSAHDIVNPVEVVHSDAEPVLFISSMSSVLESAHIAPSNADAILRDHEFTIPGDIPITVEPPVPSSLEISSTENTGLTTVPSADVESEGFLLTSSEADESVSEHPIVRDNDEEWLEVAI